MDLFDQTKNSDGSLDRHKAQLVALGNRQEYGIDYEETFALVAKMTNVRLLFAIAASQSWPLYQMDVKNAFLHGDLKEEVYMRIPQGVTSPSKKFVCHLRRSLYSMIKSLQASLRDSFHIKDLGPLYYFLGLEVH